MSKHSSTAVPDSAYVPKRSLWGNRGAMIKPYGLAHQQGNGIGGVGSIPTNP